MPSRLTYERTVTIGAPAERVMGAFFDPADLTQWSGATRAVAVPRPLGIIALEWPASGYDAVLGPLGGWFHGSVIEYEDTSFLVADAYWHPPEGDPIGPMALEVRCRTLEADEGTELTVRQTGEHAGARWTRYFLLVSDAWDMALGELKGLLT